MVQNRKKKFMKIGYKIADLQDAEYRVTLHGHIKKARMIKVTI